jgi:homopolymeric O-antigen transport system ATP-binding protein
MTKPIIEVKHISKRYRLGAFGTTTLREDLEQFLAKIRRKDLLLTPAETQKGKAIWALNDVSFDVQPGELIGIIGGNGAGKSTLLKILSRITEPTRGEAILRGRVASLLEVGTGFHPDLSGRENIFLNAAILGMSKMETKRKLDEIIAFSEVENFIDTPIKRYSSGMRVRLAFAVAAFLEPEILIVDEVLAVGDESFQRKCLGKMSDVSKHGRTILFVSHDLAAVQNLCERVIALRKGQLLTDDKPAEAIRTYLAGIPVYVSEEAETIQEGGLRISSVSVSQGLETVENILTTGKPAHFKLEVEGVEARCWCELDIYHESGAMVSRLTSRGVELTEAGFLTCIMDPLLLTPGRYRLAGSVLVQDQIQHHSEHLGGFTVRPGGATGNQIINWRGSGLVQLQHRWSADQKQREEELVH